MSHTKKCQWCGRSYEAIWHTDLQYCSNKCKNDAANAKRAKEERRREESHSSSISMKGCLWIVAILFSIFLAIYIFGDDMDEKKTVKATTANTQAKPTVALVETAAPAKKKDEKADPFSIENFSVFIQSFITGPAYQLSHIKFPLKSKTKNLDGEWIFLEEVDWRYMGENFIFQGKKDVDGYECEGSFSKKKKGEYNYELQRVSDSSIVLKMVFRPTNEVWMLTEIEEGF